ncbi:MAG: pilus assembly protein TadG-related protein [bacterium]
MRNIVQNKKRFLKNQSANIGLMTALMVAPLTMMLGGAVDLMRFANVRAEMQGAIDSGILAAASLKNARPVDTVVQEYLAANLDSKMINFDNVKTSITPRKDESGRYVTVSASYPMDTYFLKLMGINSLSVKASASGQQKWQAVEISLVVDISSSMNNTKLSALKTAAKDFVDEILEDEVLDITTISLVPFGGTVNLGDDFLGYVSNATIDPDGHDLNFSDGHLWQGCFEFGKNDFDDDDFESSHNAAIPYFWKYVDFNPWCPASNNEALFLSNSRTDLKNAIDGLSRSDGTGMDIGAAVGLKALSPAWKGVISNPAFPDRPVAYAGETLKVMVVMTDGEITQQSRPAARQCKKKKNNKQCKTYESFGCIEANKRKKKNPDKGDYIFCEGPKPESGKSKAVATNNMESICDQAKENDIVVYTVGFQINTAKDSDRLLRECASSISQYFYVEDTDIGTAFSAIASSINGIRITS